jgi:hypothetical protein
MTTVNATDAKRRRIVSMVRIRAMRSYAASGSVAALASAS